MPNRAGQLAIGAGRRLGRPGLTLLTGLAAATPVIVATVRAVRDGWIPGADQGIIATRAYDVLSDHMPLVGQYTLAGEVTGKVTHSLGPMLFWVLALPARFGAPASITVTMGAINTLAIVGSVALARRRGGIVLMFAAAVAVALMCQSLAAETFHDVWNPSAGLFPLTLLIFLCWSLACGEHRLLPLTVLVASFVVQAHLMYLAPSAGLLAVGIGGMAVSLLRDRRAASAVGALPPGRRSLLLWSAAAAVIAAVCWSAPVVEQLTERPGNLTLVVDSASRHKTTLGAGVGWHAIVRAVGVRPWWLYEPSDRWERKYDVRASPHSGAVVSAAILLVALLAVALVGLAHRRRDLLAGALIGFVLCGALAAVAASTPTPRLLSATLGYTMWWGSQVGMWVYLMIAWSAWLALGWLAARLQRLRTQQTSAPGLIGLTPLLPTAAAMLAAVVAGAACVIATGAIGGAVAKGEKPDEHQPLYRPTAALASQLSKRVPAGCSVELLGNLNIATMPIKPALRYFLVRHGVRVLARGSSLRLGSWYELYDRPFQYVVYVYDGVRPPAKGAQLVQRVRFSDRWGAHVVSLWISLKRRGEAAAAPGCAGAHRPNR